MLNRRGILLGMASSALAAPAIVHAGNLMPVKRYLPWRVVGDRLILDPSLAIAINAERWSCVTIHHGDTLTIDGGFWHGAAFDNNYGYPIKLSC